VIRALRRRHRTLMLALAVALPALLAAALAVRRQVPRLPGLAAAIDGPERSAAREIGPRSVTSLADGWFAATLLATPSAASGLSVATELAVDRGRPEWLLYWSAERPAVGGALPPQCWLLGVLRDEGPRRLELPAAAAGRDGQLVVYAPDHARVLATLPLGGALP
jgi:hypothetical protein